MGRKADIDDLLEQTKDLADDEPIIFKCTFIEIDILLETTRDW